jgi:hypothetical protein
MEVTRIAFRQGLPKKTDCLLDWKNNSSGAERSLLASRSGCNLARKTWNGGYLRRLLIARTYSLEVTSCC